MYQLIWSVEGDAPQTLLESVLPFRVWQVTQAIIEKVTPDVVMTFVNTPTRLGIEHYRLEQAPVLSNMMGGIKSITRVFHVTAAGWLIAGVETLVGSATVQFIEEITETDLTYVAKVPAPIADPIIIGQLPEIPTLATTLLGMQAQLNSLSDAIDQLSMRQLTESSLGHNDLFSRIENLERLMTRTRQFKKTEADDEALLAEEIKRFDIATLHHVERY